MTTYSFNVFVREKFTSFSLHYEKKYNQSVFFYGRTNSGKTYTFEEVLNYFSDSAISMAISEIYRGKRSELLHKTSISSFSEVLPAIKRCQRLRKTEKNIQSSRSTIILELILISGQTITLVDLMGSEKSSDDDGRINNMNLTSLSRCMTALKRREKHIPYRDCTLTLLFEKAIAKSQVSFIGCIDVSDEKETRRTLEFLQVVREIELPGVELISFEDEVPKQQELDDEVLSIFEMIRNVALKRPS